MRKINLKENVVYITFVSIFVFFSILLFNRNFLSLDNLLNISRQSAMVAIMAVGMTFVLSAGEIDLSFGSVVALSSIIGVKTLDATGSVLLSFIASISIGIFIGVVNAMLTTKIGIPSFLVTLGTMGIITGVARWISKLQSLPVDNEVYVSLFGGMNILHIPILLFWLVLITVIGKIGLDNTMFGRSILAVGGNKIAALYSGIKVKAIKNYAFIINSSLAAFTGILYTGRLHGARYTLGENDLMIVLAAVIIGGTSLFGGKGSIIGSVLGALIMGMLNNGLVLMGLSVDQQIILRGVIIILSVAMTIPKNTKKGVLLK